MKYTFEQQEEALTQTFIRHHMNTHILSMEKRDILTGADKLIKSDYTRNMPIIRTYMKCDSLDMTFYYNQDGNACYTYAGKAGTHLNDTAEKLMSAFALADKITKDMQITIQKIADRDTAAINKQVESLEKD